MTSIIILYISNIKISRYCWYNYYIYNTEGQPMQMNSEDETKPHISTNNTDIILFLIFACNMFY
jgi:hypothetical protein